MYKNSRTGATREPPWKDTTGPALNIVMKLTAAFSMVFGSAVVEFFNAGGGPFGAQ